MNAAHVIPSAFDRMVAEYEAAGKQYHIAASPHYSTRAFKFDRLDTFVLADGTTRMLFRALAGQEYILNSYKQGENLDQTKLPFLPGPATVADTSLSEAYSTDDEDFVVEGLSCTVRGVRIASTDTAAPNEFFGANGAGNGATDDTKGVILSGAESLEDPSSLVVPAEVGSPMTLQDVLWHAIRGKVSLVAAWNRKSSDHLGMGDELPEGGANSYLNANGEPTAHNFFRLPHGYVWRKEGQAQDTKFGVITKLERNAFVMVTWPGGMPSAAGGKLQSLDNLFLDVKFRYHGRAFYYPSENG